MTYEEKMLQVLVRFRGQALDGATLGAMEAACHTEVWSQLPKPVLRSWRLHLSLSDTVPPQIERSSFIPSTSAWYRRPFSRHPPLGPTRVSRGSNRERFNFRWARHLPRHRPTPNAHSRVVAPRHELVDGEGADLLEWRLRQIVQQAPEIGPLALGKPALGEHREQHVLATLRGIGFAPEQAEHERYRRAQRRPGGLRVLLPAFGFSFQRAQGYAAALLRNRRA